MILIIHQDVLETELDRRRAVDEAVDQAAAHLLLYPPTARVLAHALGLDHAFPASEHHSWERAVAGRGSLSSFSSSMIMDNSLLLDLSRTRAVMDLVSNVSLHWYIILDYMPVNACRRHFLFDAHVPSLGGIPPSRSSVSRRGGGGRLGLHARDGQRMADQLQ